MGGRKSNRRRGGPRALPRLLVWPLAVVIGAAMGWWGRGLTLDAVAGTETRIARIAVTGNQRVAPDELAAVAGLSAGMRIAEVDLERVRGNLLAHPWIRAARVARLLPDRLIVAIEERRPIAVAELPTGNVFVDDTGTPFGPADEGSALPVFAGVERARVGEPHPRFAQAMHLLDAARDQSLPVPTRIALGGRPEAELPTVSFTRSGRPELIAVLGGEEPRAGMARLAQAWMADLPEFREATEVDLRFGRQLILRGSGTHAEGSTEDDTEPAADAVASNHSHSREG